MTPDLLDLCGQALFGDEWKQPLAKALQVNIRNLRRWASGASSIPDSVRDDIFDLLRYRRAAIEEAMTQLSAVLLPASQEEPWSYQPLEPPEA